MGFHQDEKSYRWSGRWGKSTDKAFADYVKDLAAEWATIRLASDPDTVIAALGARMQAWIGALRAEATGYIDQLGVLTRDAVHQYYLSLWLWHRLEGARWKASEISLRESKKGKLGLEIDHIIAVKLWQGFDGAADDDNDATDGANLESDDTSTTMNAIGNCCLLEKSFNVAKGAEPLHAFLQRVHEFKNQDLEIGEWAKSLDIGSVLLDPTGKGLNEVRSVVEERTFRIKSELKEYIAGVRERVDV